MNVTDLPTLNSILTGCGCCPLPACEDATKLCESMCRTSNCSDNDYTDALEAWQLKDIAYTAYQAALASYPTRLAKWEADKVIYDACYAACETNCVDPGPKPVSPVNPGPPGTPPDPLTYYPNYSALSFGCFPPYKVPTGAPTDEIPNLYGTYESSSGLVYTGTGWAYYSGAGTYPLSAEFLTVGVYADAPWPDLDGADYTYTGNVHDSVDHSCTPTDSGSTPNFMLPTEATYTTNTPTQICESASRGTEVEDTSTFGSSTPKALEGCPEEGDFDESSERGWDYTRREFYLETLGESKTKSTLIARAKGKIPATWPTKPEGTTCSASTTAQWPLIKDFYVGGNPDATPPVPGSWPACDGGIFPATPTTKATACTFRYKMGIPTAMQAHRLWVDANAKWILDHAHWVTCGSDPASEPIKPVEPQIFTYFAVQWDEVSFDPKWDAWRITYDTWWAAKKLHDQWKAKDDEWVACEALTPGQCGTRPVEPPAPPPDPSASQPVKPVFVNSNLFWIWNGGETLDTQHEPTWHVVAAPTAVASIRLVNRQVKCWKSVAIGVPPTFYGETYNPLDYP